MWPPIKTIHFEKDVSFNLYIHSRCDSLREWDMLQKMFSTTQEMGSNKDYPRFHFVPSYKGSTIVGLA